MTGYNLFWPRLRFCTSCYQRCGQQRHRYATTAAARPETFDVVCIGGGPAGLSLLAGLRATKATSGLKVALVESQDLGQTRKWSLPPHRYSNRASSLTPASVHFLEKIGAWRHIQASRVQPYNEMQVWDGITGSHISFEWQFSGGDPQSGKQKTIAYMTENLNLSLALLTRLDELGLAAIYDKSKVESISLGEGEEDLDLTSWPVIEISGGRRLAARLLVGADGGNSPVRAFAGIESRGWDYERHGVVATVRLEGSGWGGNESRTAYQRFLPTGPVALLPLPGDLSTLVWSTTPTRAAHLLKLSLEDFAAMVNAAFRLSPVDLMFMHTQDQGQADEVAWREKHTRANPSLIPQRVMSIQAGSVASFPLRMRHADTYVGERITLIGDAAHTIHPLAGQGLNQGQGDVQKLVQTLGFAVEHGQDIGTQLSLESYNSERYSANNILIGVVDKLHKLYSASSGPLVPVRSWGLSAVNAMSPLKAFIMRHAAGYER